MDQHQNPYTAGDPVGKTSCFVGRENILRDIERFLKHRSQNAITLYGQRRIGKTSILQHLEMHLSERGPYYPVYFDLMGKAGLTLGEILRDLARTIAMNLNLPDPDLGSDPRESFRGTFLPDILDSLPEETILVLLLDEFDVLADPQAEQEAKRQFFGYQRDLRQLVPSRLKFIFGLGRNLDDLDILAQGLFKDLPSRRVSLLDPAETEALICLSEHNNSLEWTADAIMRVGEWTSGHPYLTQALCSNIWEEMHEAFDSPPPVSPKAVDDAIAGALERSQNMFVWLWEGLGAAEKVVAAALAAKGPIVADDERLSQILNESGVRILIRELREAPHFLQKWDILAPVEGGYRFRVEMLRCWIAENRPLSRAQDELDRIQPAAENLYQAAYNLYRNGDLRNAEPILKQVLELNPNHIRGNELLAEVLIARDALVDAVKVLETLEEMFPGTGIARLKQVYYRIGERNLKQGDLDLALDAFQKAEANDQIAEIRSRLQVFRLSTRPALIIGIGGTGQWVLTLLKKELLEIGGGKMPLGVKLLAFDTTSQSTAETRQSYRRGQGEDIRAGTVSLVEGKEFISIGGNVSELAKEISQGKHAHLQWFPAKNFLSKLPPAAFNTQEGSGQIRQMGRIALFHDLAAINKSEILFRLRAAIQELRTEVSRDRQLEVIIVSSLAGGTGAGMLVDMALLVHAQAAKLVQNNYVVRGFFVLPRAFAVSGIGGQTELYARAFATWRELDRFMIMSENFGLHHMNYHEQSQDLRIKVDRRAYDVSYLIESARIENSLENINPEEGIFPAVAHTISAILDDKAGKGYTEFITTNLAGRLANLPRRSYYSAIGSYTLKMPIFYEEEKYSHQLVLNVLDELLKPQIDVRGNILGVSQFDSREISVNSSGGFGAHELLSSSSFSYEGIQILNSKFLQLVADIKDKDAIRDSALIQNDARGGLASSNSRYLFALIDINQDQEGISIIQKITSELQKPIWIDVPPSRKAKDSPEDAFNRIVESSQRIRREYYGRVLSSGVLERGRFGEVLEEAKFFQITRFRKLIHAWTLKNLNGESNSGRIAHSGKIGYVHSSFEELVDSFSYFIKFLKELQVIRSEKLQLSRRVDEAVRSALNNYSLAKNKKSLLTFWNDFIHPDAYNTQLEYLRAEQNLIDVRKDDILLYVLIETAEEMRVVAEKTLAEINEWISYLATGDSTREIQGLYSTVRASLENVQINHELDKRLNKVCRIVGEQESVINEDQITEIINRFIWKVTEENGHLSLTCGFLPVSDIEGEPLNQLVREGSKSDQHNLNLFLTIARQSYYALRKDHQLAREIKTLYPTGKELAPALINLAGPMYMKAHNQPEPEMSSCFTRIQSNFDQATTQYFREFEEEIRVHSLKTERAQYVLVDSQDPYKMSIIRSDDLMPSESLEMWHLCRTAYIREVTNPNRGIPAADLHIFPAEINASYYEQEIPTTLHQNYRILTPEVVTLLEDRERFEMFFRAFALGFIRIVDKGGYSSWIYSLNPEEDKNIIYLSSQNANLSNGADVHNIIQLIHNFVVEGVDQRPGMGKSRFVDWTKLRDAILSLHHSLGKEKATQLYRFQIDAPDGIANRILAITELDHRRRQSREFVNQENIDLADLAKIIYLKAIQSFDSAGR